MTSQEEQSFLTVIVANPDDDTPRLVFADWLDERGTDDDRARAALIRAQCRLEYLPTGRERRKLEGEAKAILRANAKRWTNDLREADLNLDWQFRRGFLDGVQMSATLFVEQGKELFALAPTVRTVYFPRAANELTQLAASPFLARLASVDLTQMCTCGYCPIDVELRDLFRSKHAKGLQHLNVSRDRFDAAGARALARSAHLANLTSLDLSDNPVRDDGAAALVAARHLTKLVRLNLARTDLRAAGVEALATAKHFPSLARLELSGNEITAEGVRALVAAPFFKQLTALDLSKNRIAEAGAKALAEAADESKLEFLDLRTCRLGQKAIKLMNAAFGKKVKL